jgi:hypothetical protein
MLLGVGWLRAFLATCGIVVRSNRDQLLVWAKEHGLDRIYLGATPAFLAAKVENSSAIYFPWHISAIIDKSSQLLNSYKHLILMLL